jgi:hypothetical protein
MQTTEERRVDVMKATLLKYADILSAAGTGTTGSISSVMDTFKAVNKAEDSKQFIQLNRTTSALPATLVYEAYGVGIDDKTLSACQIHLVSMTLEPKSCDWPHKAKKDKSGTA